MTPVLLLAIQLAAPPDALAEKSERARQAMAGERFEEAEKLYSELVRSTPGNPGLLMNLGLAQQAAGKHARAVEQFQAVVKLEPEFAPGWLLLGMSLVKLGRLESAVAPLERTLELEPGHHGARQELAGALLELGRFEDAAARYFKLVQAEPGNPDAWCGLGLSYLAAGREALAALEKAAPASAEWYAAQARLRAERRDFPGAFALYRKALAASPDFFGVHGALAEIYRQTGHADWAATEEERETAAAPPDCQRQPLACEFHDARYWQLIEAARSRQSAESWFWRFQAYGELALIAWTRLAELPPSAEWHEAMAVFHSAQGRFAEAAAQWRQALELAPSDRRLQRELGLTLWLARDLDGARTLLARLGSAAGFDEALGRALLEARPFPQRLRAALDNDGDGRLHTEMARAWTAVEETKLAAEARARALSLGRTARAQGATATRSRLRSPAQLFALSCVMTLDS